MDGLCECGCGQPAPVATRNHTKYGWVKGKPMRFVRGHATRGKPHSPETREKLRVIMTGRTHTWGAKISEAQLGANGPGWRGGTIIREGRTLQYVGRDHPMADSYGYVYLHRLVISRVLGRPLLPTEHVHHRDLDRANNAVENLIVLTPGDHKRVHNLITQKGLDPEAALAAVLAARDAA